MIYFVYVYDGGVPKVVVNTCVGDTVGKNVEVMGSLDEPPAVTTVTAEVTTPVAATAVGVTVVVDEVTWRAKLFAFRVNEQ